MTQNEMFDYLNKKIGSETFTAALLGNMKAESALKPTNLQNSYEKKLGYNDETYTKAVDDGTISAYQFAHDGAGYGMVQWTHWARKQGLYLYAKQWKTSIGCLETQLDWCLTEMQLNYSGLWNRRKDLTLYEATKYILTQYERPADQSEANVQRRLKLATEILTEWGKAQATGDQGEKLHVIMENLENVRQKMENLAADCLQIEGEIYRMIKNMEE